jgi:hypothetical protein
MTDPKTASTVLIDAPLVPDTDADSELNQDATSLLADEEISEARFILRRTAIEPVTLDGAQGTFVAFACTFHGTSTGARFTNARIHLVLDDPKDAAFVDVEPTMDALEEVVIEYNVDEKLNVKIVEAGATTKHRVATYTARIKGSGDGTRRACWTLEEGHQTGIPHETMLLCTLVPTGRLSVRAIISARIEKRGVGGALQAARNLLLGPYERQYQFTLDVPAQR